MRTGSEQLATEAAPRSARHAERKAWWRWFAPLVLLCIAWGLATPPFGAPDEHPHMVRAAGVARGRITGPEVMTPFGYLIDIEVPRTLANLASGVACFAKNPTVTPDCVREPTARSGTTTVPIWQGRFPLLYYALTAAPTLVSQSYATLYAMRLISAVVAAAFLASAFVSARRLGRWATLGVAAAITPMAIYLAGVLNPGGLEIASATAFLMSAFALVRGPPIDTRLVARACIAWIVAVNSRSITLVMLGLVGVALVSLAPRERAREIWGTRARRWWLAGAAAGAGAATVWGLTLGRFTRTPLPRMDFTLADGIYRTWRIFEESVAWFGLLEVRVLSAIVIFLALWFMLVGIALAIGRRRDRVVLCVIVLTAIAFPIAVSLLQPPPLLAVWLGRYSIPLWVAVPIVAGGIVSVAPSRPSWLATRGIVGAFALAVGVAQLAAFATHARRYAVGSGKTVFYFVDPTWTGPVHPAMLLVIATVAIGWLVQNLVTTSPMMTSDGSSPIETRTSEADLTMAEERS